jgi:hypothetical protein
MLENKKTAVDLTDLAFGIVILGLTVAIGATVVVNIRNNQILDTATRKITLETVTPVGAAGTPLANTWVKSVDACQNSTGEILATANYTYTISPDTGTAKIFNTTSDYTVNSWRCNYTVYNTSDPRYTLPNTASIGLMEYGNWFKIIVIVGVAATILALIFMAFGKGGSASAGGAAGGIGGTY